MIVVFIVCSLSNIIIELFNLNLLNFTIIYHHLYCLPCFDAVLYSRIQEEEEDSWEKGYYEYFLYASFLAAFTG